MNASQLGLFRVLIVDDEKTITRLVSDVLIRLGFRDLTVANSGGKATEFLEKQKFDFVITDWRMQDMDGIDLVRFIRTSPASCNPQTAVIMLTGNTEAHYVLTALNAGINGYLIKPFSVEQLVRRIRVIIENPRSFILAPGYRGPDRRYNNQGGPNNVERRKSGKT